MPKQTREDIEKIIHETLDNFYGAARRSVVRHWNKKELNQQRAAVRALGVMQDVAMNPMKYFSRATTMDEWRRRSAQYKSGMVVGGYSTNSSPADCLSARVSSAFEDALGLQYLYNRFCNAVVDWDYKSTSDNARDRETADASLDAVADIIAESKTWKLIAHKKQDKRLAAKQAAQAKQAAIEKKRAEKQAKKDAKEQKKREKQAAIEKAREEKRIEKAAAKQAKKDAKEQKKQAKQAKKDAARQAVQEKQAAIEKARMEKTTQVQDEKQEKQQMSDVIPVSETPAVAAVSDTVQSDVLPSVSDSIIQAVQPNNIPDLFKLNNPILNLPWIDRRCMAIVPVEKIIQAIVPVEKIIQAIVPVEKTVQAIVPVEKTVQTLVPVQKMTQAIVPLKRRDAVKKPVLMLNPVKSYVPLGPIEEYYNAPAESESNDVAPAPVEQYSADISESAQADNYIWNLPSLQEILMPEKVMDYVPNLDKLQEQVWGLPPMAQRYVYIGECRESATEPKSNLLPQIVEQTCQSVVPASQPVLGLSDYVPNWVLWTEQTAEQVMVQSHTVPVPMEHYVKNSVNDVTDVKSVPETNATEPVAQSEYRIIQPNKMADKMEKLHMFLNTIGQTCVHVKEDIK